MNLPNTTLPANHSALPESWIERIFQKMEDRYGSLWVDRYGQFPRERVKASWADDLSGMTGEEIKRGLDACKLNKFPPTLPEFVILCRPPIDFEAAFHHAISQMHNRRNGEPDRWNNKAIYWAAASLGSDLIQEYRLIEKRWKATLAEFMAEDVLPEVPIPVQQLPAPGQETISIEQAKRNIEKIREMLNVGAVQE